jgi:hypothetical protein
VHEALVAGDQPFPQAVAFLRIGRLKVPLMEPA